MPLLNMTLKILLIPLHKPRHPLVHRRAGFVIKLLHQVLHIGKGVGHIAGLQGQQVHLGFFAQGFFYGGYVVQQLHRLVVANVVHPPWRSAGGGVGLGAVPAGVGWGGSV